VDIYYNYTDQWINITVSNYATPMYSSTFWSSNNNAQNMNNCYNYANNHETDNYAQPGYAHGYTFTQSQITGSKVGGGVTADYISSSDPGDGSTPIALMIDTSVDFHFARRDGGSNGVIGLYWSHKPGTGPSSQSDGNGQMITDPSTANWHFSGSGLTYTYYNQYFTPSDSVQGGGHAVISGPSGGGGGE